MTQQTKYKHHYWVEGCGLVGVLEHVVIHKIIADKKITGHN